MFPPFFESFEKGKMSGLLLYKYKQNFYLIWDLKLLSSLFCRHPSTCSLQVIVSLINTCYIIYNSMGYTVILMSSRRSFIKDYYHILNIRILVIIWGIYFFSKAKPLRFDHLLPILRKFFKQQLFCWVGFKNHMDWWHAVSVTCYKANLNKTSHVFNTFLIRHEDPKRNCHPGRVGIEDNQK